MWKMWKNKYDRKWKHFLFHTEIITEEGIKKLKDVNKTYEFYDEYREIVINKKVAQIIKENVPICKILPCYFR